MVKDMMISIVSPRRKSMGGLFIQKEIGQGGWGVGQGGLHGV